MVARPGRPQAKFTAGELDASLGGRTDLEYYQSGAKLMRNVEIVAQGGFKQKPGLRHIAETRGPMELMALAAIAPSAPAGGTAANGMDGNEATQVVSGALAVTTLVYEATFTAAAILAFDVIDYSSVGGSGSLRLDWRIGAAWTQGPARAVSKTLRSRRFVPPVGTAAINGVRLTVVSPTVSFGAFSFGEIRAYGTSSRTVAQLFAFTDREGLNYDVMISAQSGECFGDAGAVGYFHAPATHPMVPQLVEAQDGDTLLLFHKAMTPWKIQVQAGAAEWDFRPLAFENIPNHDFGDTIYTNGTASKWQLDFYNFVTAGGLNASAIAFIITVSGEEAEPVTCADDGSGGIVWASTPAIIEAAIEALDGIDAGITVASPADKQITVEFTGANNLGSAPVVSVRVVNKADAAVTSYRLVKGVDPGEPILSASRGWPACGAFWQQRLLMGGLNQIGHVWLYSVLGDFYNLNRTIPKTGGGVVPMDVLGGEKILRIVPSRYLQFHTSKGEYWVPNRGLTNDEAPVLVLASRNGTVGGLPIVDSESASLFIGRNDRVNAPVDSGANLFEMRYSEADAGYITQSVSLLAPHLARDIRDMTLKAADGEKDTNVAYLATADGTARAVTLMRQQKVTAFARCETAGNFHAFSVRGDNRVSALVDRTIDGVTARHLERFDPSLLLDFARDFTFLTPTQIITGLGAYEGAEVWAIADRDVEGPFIVENGEITLGAPAQNVTIGLWTPPYVETMPPPREVAPGVVIEKPARIHTVRVNVIATTSIAIGANGGPQFDVDMAVWGAPFDVPHLDAAVTGEIVLDGFEGYEDKPTIVLTQKRPGFLQVVSVIAEIDL